MSEFSESLKRWRKTNHYTTREAAEQLGVSAAAISRWENEQRVPHPFMQSGILHAIRPDPFVEFS